MNRDVRLDGEANTITATRTVVLSFDRTGNAKIVKLTIKYADRRPEPRANPQLRIGDEMRDNRRKG
jgi:hypothetical protein